jgi:hypothetical protein
MYHLLQMGQAVEPILLGTVPATHQVKLAVNGGWPIIPGAEQATQKQEDGSERMPEITIEEGYHNQSSAVSEAV